VGNSPGFATVFSNKLIPHPRQKAAEIIRAGEPSKRNMPDCVFIARRGISSIIPDTGVGEGRKRRKGRSEKKPIT